MRVTDSVQNKTMIFPGQISKHSSFKMHLLEIRSLVSEEGSKLSDGLRKTILIKREKKFLKYLFLF